MKQSVIKSSIGEQKLTILSVALAIFAMLFGSGNIFFPLGLGRDTGEMAFYAMLGFFASGVLAPLVGIIVMILYKGSYEQFFQTIGKIPGKIVILLCMLLIGPLCVIPRSISLAHASLKWVYPSLDLFFFSIFAVILIFLITDRKSGLLDVLGKVLGPVKLVLLSAIIIKGFFVVYHVVGCSATVSQTLLTGFVTGYGTLDLLGAIFFTNIILAGLKARTGKSSLTAAQVSSIALKGGVIGAFLLGIVYAGFILVAALQSYICQGIDQKQLLSKLASLLLGDAGGILASVTIAVACLTTAVALTTVFAEYVSKDLAHKHISYKMALILTSLLTLFFANYGFEGIMNFIAPIVVVLYPALIALAIAQIIYKLFDIDMGKYAFYITLVVTLLVMYKPF